MKDEEILHRINGLIAEEQALHERGGEHGGLSEAEQARLHSLEVCLDQLWDYLRQRRARRHAGLDPDGAKLRDPAVVERYVQ